ncbi:type II toxin-antitoxin system PemK/MazF family toxin [Limosilactobacillus reuteri]|uniref:type II toxin-antitoxin system PemK/MazF family toxin n=1 Tax=Limosilactobacillus reuteri TaxID=1598 RepID=UPI001E2F1C7D|nr:type II toxin-antitoxin system PemK/MazF family toxin [Limosilactobacillus reuteri]MCC4466743.1 type II toxin-antitoxin system PemK/MazF family toxin [Limosilactobacillus reuteri]MCC4474140.1 type II toxin-antitoxin system PemK/MazF family toxin [Limosilactobacillus reuteri]
MKTYYRQGDVIYMDFSPAIGNEIQGMRPAVVVSSDNFNRYSNYLMVVPVTNHGNDSGDYVELNGYRNVHGRVNTAQVHCFSVERAGSTPMDQLRVKDFNMVMRGIKSIMKTVM